MPPNSIGPQVDGTTEFCLYRYLNVVNVLDMSYVVRNCTERHQLENLNNVTFFFLIHNSDAISLSHTDSIYEQNWPFPGQDPTLWKTLEIVPF